MDGHEKHTCQISFSNSLLPALKCDFGESKYPPYVFKDLNKMLQYFLSRFPYLPGTACIANQVSRASPSEWGDQVKGSPGVELFDLLTDVLPTEESYRLWFDRFQIHTWYAATPQPVLRTNHIKYDTPLQLAHPNQLHRCVSRVDAVTWIGVEIYGFTYCTQCCFPRRRDDTLVLERPCQGQKGSVVSTLLGKASDRARRTSKNAIHTKRRHFHNHALAYF